MKVAIDTNVLVRYLTWDDERQARLSADIIEAAEAVVVSTIVLCETVWVLRRAYRLGHVEIAAVLRRLVEAETVEVDRPAAEAGLASLDRGGDFADGVILFDADRARADEFVTFDRSFAAGAGSTRLRLLDANQIARRAD